ncbi:MAG: hypothetical protein B6U95_04800 [Thermofilum sp. ex4484_82]|nr:hypothetical protein [Candidatus Baldrarchaeota archaeon]OYT28099.1 MAG: hypothetical protein B6U95_04800 [Thermofilum sp. ex4484_82]OYT38294.1 MAG: hypothetical protein B6U96_04795 [Archaeoglobales archaeon ex4484_92]
MRFWKKIKNSLKDFLYGMTVADMVQTVKKMEFNMNAALMSVTIGDLIGLVIFPPIYKYNLLVHWFSYIDVWKREVLREKEFIEKKE